MMQMIDFPITFIFYLFIIFSIQGFAKLLKDKSITNKEKAEYIDIIIEESERLANLSTSIQNLTKIENKKEIFKKEKVAVDEQIRKCVVLLNSKLEEKNIEMEIDAKAFRVVNDEGEKMCARFSPFGEPQFVD